jgi:signal transduction histidine kinase
VDKAFQIFFVPKGHFGLMIALNMLAQFCAGPTSALTWALYADVADYGEFKYGRRSTGLIYSASLFSIKTGILIGGFLVPLFLARQMFFRSRALEEAHEELQDRAKVLRRLSNRMAEERQDERMQIAGYLHDDLAQLLFQLSLQTDLVERLLGEGDIEGARAMLADLRDTKELASERMRSLVSDLHRSPIGRKGLSEALRSFTDEVGRDAVSRFELEVVDLPLPPPIQLLVYQIAHEAVMNALKYADASTIEISFAERAHAAELVVRDDGAGFDTEAGEPEGHYGLTMMRERATVAGGTFDIVSARGHGTAITVRFPAEWLQTNGVAQTEPSEEKRPKIPTPVEATPTPPVDARTDFA